MALWNALSWSEMYKCWRNLALRCKATFLRFQRLSTRICYYRQPQATMTSMRLLEYLLFPTMAWCSHRNCSGGRGCVPLRKNMSFGVLAALTCFHPCDWNHVNLTINELSTGVDPHICATCTSYECMLPADACPVWLKAVTFTVPERLAKSKRSASDLASYHISA